MFRTKNKKNVFSFIFKIESDEVYNINFIIINIRIDLDEVAYSCLSMACNKFNNNNA